MNTDDYILLYVPEDKTKNVTVKDYKAWRDAQKKDEIADFIYERLYRRYIKPFEFNDAKYKSGFSMMANSCLLIETLESFYRGWGKSPNSELAFLKFFTRDKRFTQFSVNDIPTQFYKHIRCGILHQGETTGGWKINRMKSSPLLDESKREINANEFLKRLKVSLNDYHTLLKTSDWNSSYCWEMSKKKMKAILENCEWKS